MKVDLAGGWFRQGRPVPFRSKTLKLLKLVLSAHTQKGSVRLRSRACVRCTYGSGRRAFVILSSDFCGCGYRDFSLKSWLQCLGCCPKPPQIRTTALMSGFTKQVRLFLYFLHLKARLHQNEMYAVNKTLNGNDGLYIGLLAYSYRSHCNSEYEPL